MNCQDRLDSLEANINTLIDKADDLENRSRRNNLCFEGIDEQMHGNETWEESEHKVKRLKDLISNTLQIDADNIEIERAHRVGKKRPTSDKPRTIVAKFLNYKHRGMVLNERRKLKGSNLIIREDFSDRVVAKRRELLPQMF